MTSSPLKYRISLNDLEEKYYDQNLIELIKKSLEVLKPKEMIGIIEWAEKNIVLDDTTPIPGPFRIRHSPHLREPLEAVTDPYVRKITIMGSAQFGKTLFMLITWAYFVDQDPSPMLIMQPTDREADSFSMQKLEPLIESSPLLESKVLKKRRGNSSNSTIKRKLYQGGWTEIISGTSKGTTRQRSVKRTMADDIDALEISKITEGDHVQNLEDRTKAFKYNFLHINISTPRIKGESKIEFKYEEGSKGKYSIKCLACETTQTFDEDQLHYDQDFDLQGNVTESYPASCRVACKGCGELFTEKDRIQMLELGFYVHEKSNKSHRSYWLGQIMSILSNLETVVDAKIKAEKALDAGDDSTYESYINNTLGLPYKKHKGKETDAKYLLDRREDYLNSRKTKIPNGVLVITGAVDVQAGSGKRAARLELECWGWGIGEECWILDKQEFPGNPEKQETWDALDAHMAKIKFTRKDGITLNVSRTLYDSGYLAETVYAQTHGKLIKKKILAFKGANKYGAPLIPKKLSETGRRKTKLIIVGTQAAKGILFERLNAITEHGRKYIHHTKQFCDVEYYDQLTAEHAITKTVGLSQYIVYEKKQRHLANEALDLLVMNYAAMKSLLPQFEKIEKSLKKNIDHVPEEEKHEEAPIKKTPQRNVRRQKNFVTGY